mmetsp:Transcript_9654/g.23036  ORF Transcript_9654/g.23036 Transcript_9654/m.23036 type:complete len:200 (-) Transcript_9654:7-606(-)
MLQPSFSTQYSRLLCTSSARYAPLPNRLRCSEASWISKPPVRICSQAWCDVPWKASTSLIPSSKCVTLMLLSDTPGASIIAVVSTLPDSLAPSTSAMGLHLRSGLRWACLRISSLRSTYLCHNLDTSIRSAWINFVLRSPPCPCCAEAFTMCCSRANVGLWRSTSLRTKNCWQSCVFRQRPVFGGAHMELSEHNFAVFL